MPVESASLSTRAWAWTVLGTTILLCVGVAAFNAVVDPTAQLGTGLLEPVAAGPRDRTAKVQLLDDGPLPEVVVLGSSRTKKLDPTWIGAGRGVNAAVVGGDLFEARVLAAWLAERAREQGEPMPRLVVGVDVEQFRDSSLQGSGFLDLPQVERVARREAAGSDGSVAGELERVERLLLTMQVTKASLASLRARIGARPAAAADDDGRQESGFTEAGVSRADARWQQPAQAQRFAARTPGAVERTIGELRAAYRARGATLDQDAVDDLRALARIASRADGPPPVLYVTPAHPRLARELGPAGRDERASRVRALLEGVARQYGAIHLDCSSCIDGSDTSWIDATHPSPLGMRQLADRLRAALRDQAPRATPVDRSGASR